MESPPGLSIRNPRVQRIRRLVQRGVERRAERRCVVEGVRGVRTALDAGLVEGLYVTPSPDAVVADLAAAASREGVTVEVLADGVLERIADAATPQPVLAVVETPARGPGDLVDPSLSSLILVLVDVREPGNAGTLVRSAEAAGASAVVFCRGSADPWSPKVVRAAAGALFHVPIVVADDRQEVLDVLAQAGVRRLASASQGGDAYDAVDWTAPTAVLLGNEAWGLPDDVAAVVDGWVTVPHAGRAESLNVAMAGSVLLFEAARQRRGAAS